MRSRLKFSQLKLQPARERCVRLEGRAGRRLIFPTICSHSIVKLSSLDPTSFIFFSVAGVKPTKQTGGSYMGPSIRQPDGILRKLEFIFTVDHV